MTKGYITQCANASRGCDRTIRLAKPLQAGEKWHCGECKADPAKSGEGPTQPIPPFGFFPICVGDPYDLDSTQSDDWADDLIYGTTKP